MSFDQAQDDAFGTAGSETRLANRLFGSRRSYGPTQLALSGFLATRNKLLARPCVQ